MAAGLYEAVPEFAAPMDDFLAALGPEGARLREEWLRPAPNPALDDALVSQPLLFGVGYALGRCVTALSGHAPDVLLGHSVGELAAAALAGVFSPEDAARVMAARRTALAGRTGGGMLAVGAAVADVEALLAPGTAVAAVNGPRQTVLAGPAEPLARTAERLAAAGLVVRALRSGHAFHSPSLAGAAETYARGGGFFTSDGWEAENRAAIDEAVTLGTDTVVLVSGGLTPAFPDPASARARITEAIGALAPYAGDRGIRLAVEPLHPMYAADRCAVSTLDQALAVAEHFPPEQVGVVVDTYHLWWDDRAPAAVERAGASGRIHSFQLADWTTPLPAGV
ncbi:acyltransferase domain-containing protein, partial [Streptomyces massasporeus]